MTEPLRIPLSPFQLRRLAQIKGEIDAAQRIVNEITAMVIAGTTDPSTLRDHAIAIEGDDIVCTPPAVPREGA